MDFTKFLDGLSAGELEVEYRVRGLNSQQSESKDILMQSLLGEQRDRKKKPIHSHISMGSDPSLEVETCRRKFEELNVQMGMLGLKPSSDDLCAALCRSKHYKDRAERLLNSFGNVGDINNIYSNLRRISNHYIKILQDYAKEKPTELEDPNRSLALPTNITPTLGSTHHENNNTTNLNPPINSFNPNNEGGAQGHSSTGAIHKTHFNNTDNTKITPSSSKQQSEPFKNLLEGVDPDLVLAIAELVTKVQISNNADFRDFEEKRRSSILGGGSHKKSLEENEDLPFFANPVINRHRSFGPQSGNQIKVQDSTHHLRRRWNLSFCGDSSGNVKDFVYRIETMARDDGISDQMLTRCLHLFLDGKALDWYWVFKQGKPYASWRCIRDGLVGYFSSFESEEETREAIIRRFQGPKESFSDFALEIQKLNGRLFYRLSDQEIINRLCQNMNPALKNVTLGHQGNFGSIEDLRIICQRFERMWSQTGYDPRLFIDSSRRRPQIHEISAAQDAHGSEQKLYSQYAPDNSQFSVYNQVNDQQMLSNSTASNLDDPPQQGETISAVFTDSRHKVVDPNSKTHLICWNCKDIGHSFFDCHHDLKHKFCFGCGKENVLKPNCYNCQKRKSENLKPNVMYSRDARSDPNLSTNSK